jgi:hypothetical protein
MASLRHFEDAAGELSLEAADGLSAALPFALLTFEIRGPVLQAFGQPGVPGPAASATHGPYKCREFGMAAAGR